jgi:hypothetical protein
VDPAVVEGAQGAQLAQDAQLGQIGAGEHLWPKGIKGIMILNQSGMIPFGSEPA